MGLIDADALLEEMYKYSDNEGAKMPYGDNDSLIHRDSACFLIENAPTIEPEQRWIPCSERLPNEHERMKTYSHPDRASSFIVTIKGSNIPTVLYLTADNYWKDENGYYYSVSAWMPLPDPWKEEKE